MSASGSEGEKTATASRYDPTNKSFKENFDFVKVIGEGSFSTVRTSTSTSCFLLLLLLFSLYSQHNSLALDETRRFT